MTSIVDPRLPPKALTWIFFGWICFVFYAFSYVVLRALNTPTPAAWFNAGVQIGLDVIIFILGGLLAYRTKYALFLIIAFIGLVGVLSDGIYEYLVNIMNADANTDPRALPYLISYAIYLILWFVAWSVICYSYSLDGRITALSLVSSGAIALVFGLIFIGWYIRPILAKELTALVKTFHIGFSVCQIVNITLAFVSLMNLPSRFITLLTLGYGTLTATDFILRTEEIDSALRPADPFELTWTFGQLLIIFSLVSVPIISERLIPERNSAYVSRTTLIASIALVPTLISMIAVVLIQSREILVFSLFLIVLMSGAVYYYFSSYISAAAVGVVQALVASAKRDGAEKIDRRIIILFLGSNPTDETHLALTKEVRAIDRHLRSVEFHDRFRLEQQWDTQAKELPAMIMRFKPTIIHFAGHGSASGALKFVDEAGKAQGVEPEVLAKTFELHNDTIRCIVLNACYAGAQAEALSKTVDVVVGMSSEIGDEDAIAFSSAFYEAIGYGKSIFHSFEIAKNVIDLSNLTDSDLPILLCRPGVDPLRVYLCQPS